MTTSRAVGWRGGLRLHARPCAAARARCSSASHAAPAAPIELRGLAVRRLDLRPGSSRRSHRRTTRAPRSNASGLAARAARAARIGRPPQRTDRGRVEPAGERQHHASVALLDRQAGRLRSMRQPGLEALAQLGEVVMPEPGIHAHRGAQVGRCGRRDLRQFGGQSVVGALGQSAFAEQADQPCLDRRCSGEIEELRRRRAGSDCPSGSPSSAPRTGSPSTACRNCGARSGSTAAIAGAEALVISTSPDARMRAASASSCHHTMYGLS